MASRKRILLTGASGFVAGSIIAQASESIDLHAVSRGPPISNCLALRWHQLTLNDSASWEGLFNSVRPHGVIHNAAVADIDFSQANPGICRQVNVEFTRALAQ